jgi:hypothetical protein
MYFAALIPLIIISIIFSVLRSAEQKKRQEAQRQAREQQARAFTPQPVQQQQPRPAVRPTVQAPSPARQAAAPAPLASTLKPTPAPRKTQPTIMEGPPSRSAKNSQAMHPEHDLCALRSDDPKGTAHAHSTVQQNRSPLQFTPDSILNGVILSEILGKPKAARN